MTAVSDRILNWLYSSLTSEYHNVNRTYSDVAQCLSHYSSLSPRTDVYTYENGAPALLLLLSGTLPVSFRGTTYRFPVQLWVPHAYPLEAPIAYVKPSQSMVVRPGQHVSAEGRIYHPYLAQWGKYSDKSNILEFLNILRGVFAKEPPVIARQQPQGGQQPSMPRPAISQASMPPPLPPPPEELRRSATLPPQSPSTYSQPLQTPPPPPPKSKETRANEGDAAQAGSASDGLPIPPALPPKPGGQQQPWARHDEKAAYTPGLGRQYVPQRIGDLRNEEGPPLAPLPSTGHAKAWTNFYGASSPPTVQALPQRAAGNNYDQPRVQRTFSVNEQGHLPPHTPYIQGPAQIAPLQPAGPFSYTAYPPASFVTQLPVSQTPSRPPQPAVDLLSSPLDITPPSQSINGAPLPAPPIPPNPEKDALLAAVSQTLLQQLHTTLSQHATTISSLQAQRSALLTAQQNMQAEMEALNNLDATLTSNGRILHEAMSEADKVMERARERKVPDVDEVLVAPTVVGEQLYQVVAEERGIADAIFLLGKALDRGRVGTDVFIRQTRAVAREQFLKKALIKKISKGMGLIYDERR